MPKAVKGFVVWQGNSPDNGEPIVAILTVNSTNRKTGDMAQLWILHSEIHPVMALQTGNDKAVCGSCPLRGDGTGKSRACYVEINKAPAMVYGAYKRGNYPIATPDDIKRVLNNRKIRLGAYGDPAMLPISLVKEICDAAIGWTGYTHQWRNIDPEWSHYLMASSDNVADRRESRELGWRSFYVVPVNADKSAISGAVECMATRDKNKLQCISCMACSGTRRDTVPNAVDIFIIAHGAGARLIG